MVIILVLFLMDSEKVPSTVIPAKAGVYNLLKLMDPGACPGPDPGIRRDDVKRRFGLFTSPSLYPQNCHIRLPDATYF
jgi:hypothetical protein